MAKIGVALKEITDDEFNAANQKTAIAGIPIVKVGDRCLNNLRKYP